MFKKNILNIVLTVIAVVAHVSLVAALYVSYRYIAIYPSLIGSIVGIVACLVIITDIIIIVGIGYKDVVLKIISLVLTVFIYNLALNFNLSVDKICDRNKELVKI